MGCLWNWKGDGPELADVIFADLNLEEAQKAADERNKGGNHAAGHCQ